MVIWSPPRCPADCVTFRLHYCSSPEIDVLVSGAISWAASCDRRHQQRCGQVRLSSMSRQGGGGVRRRTSSSAYGLTGTTTKAFTPREPSGEDSYILIVSKPSPCTLRHGMHRGCRQPSQRSHIRLLQASSRPQSVCRTWSLYEQERRGSSSDQRGCRFRGHSGRVGHRHGRHRCGRWWRWRVQ
jgi:hypothetical protein